MKPRSFAIFISAVNRRSENVEKTLSAEANTISDSGNFGLPNVYSGCGIELQTSRSNCMKSSFWCI